MEKSVPKLAKVTMATALSYFIIQIPAFVNGNGTYRTRNRKLCILNSSSHDCYLIGLQTKMLPRRRLRLPLLGLSSPCLRLSRMEAISCTTQSKTSWLQRSKRRFAFPFLWSSVIWLDASLLTYSYPATARPKEVERVSQNPDRWHGIHFGCAYRSVSSRFDGITLNLPYDMVSHHRCLLHMMWTRTVIWIEPSWLPLFVA